MTQVTLSHSGDKYSVVAEGHATGSVEVCAAVSTLLYTLSGWIINNETMLHENQLDSGSARIVWQDGGAASRAVYEAIVIGFLQLQRAYPETINVEVRSVVNDSK